MAETAKAAGCIAHAIALAALANLLVPLRRAASAGTAGSKTCAIMGP